ncbi:MAG: phytanoyl-CoA dioxygenase family protein, partial [Nitrososphaera sp.]|nr:phytanoyl-CoA dioxygenase family protein [Nitrososphaera sp.]
RAICSSGDMILFNARLVHAAGVNKTSRTRHSLTLNFCRSYMRQRFDFPRLVPPSIVDNLGLDGRRLIGMNVRVPTSLEEFYLPEEQRLYKPNQE